MSLVFLSLPLFPLLSLLLFFLLVDDERNDLPSPSAPSTPPCAKVLRMEWQPSMPHAFSFVQKSVYTFFSLSYYCSPLLFAMFSVAQNVQHHTNRKLQA